MSIIVANQDVTENVIQRGLSTESLIDFVGRLSSLRSYVVQDNKGLFTNESSIGAFYRNNWRDLLVKETNQNEDIFSGALQSLKTNITDDGITLEMPTRDPMGTLLRFPIEENAILYPDSLGNSLYRVQGATAAGSNNIVVSSIPPLPSGNFIPLPAVVIFRNQFTPRYEIVNVNNDINMTIQIFLDRVAENNLIVNDKLRISVAVEKTFSQAMKDALTAVGLGSKLDSSFDMLSAIDSTANRFVRLFILQEERKTLSEHLTRLSVLGDLVLTTDASGNIGVRRGLAGNSQYRITGDEMIRPLTLSENVDKLITGYELLYASSNNEVAIASGQVSPELINKYRATKILQPISVEGQNIFSYNYLYNSGTTADYFGQQAINYYSTPKKRLSVAIKRNFSGTNKKIKSNLGDVVDLSFKAVSLYSDQQAVILQKSFDDKSQTTKLELEFTSKPVFSQKLNQPSIISIQKLVDKIVIVIDTQIANIEVNLFSPKGFYKKSSMLVVAAALPGNQTQLTLTSINYIQGDSVKLRSILAGNKSDFTQLL